MKVSFFPLILGSLQVSGDPKFGTVPEAFLHSGDGGQQAKDPAGGADGFRTLWRSSAAVAGYDSCHTRALA